MNKQELIERIKRLDEPYLKQEFVLELVKQLDEPKPVKVPPLVSVWITHSKNIGRSLFGAMSIFEENFEIKKWMQWAENQEIFAKAWLDGYEVDKEKRYTVKLKNVRDIFGILNFSKRSKEWRFTDSNTNNHHETKHTRKQLEEAGFGWVFDCPGIEIEEVEYDTNA